MLKPSLARLGPLPKKYASSCLLISALVFIDDVASRAISGALFGAILRGQWSPFGCFFGSPERPPRYDFLLCFIGCFAKKVGSSEGAI